VSKGVASVTIKPATVCLITREVNNRVPVSTERGEKVEMMERVAKFYFILYGINQE
jgi:hypothetical protein